MSTRTLGLILFALAGTTRGQDAPPPRHPRDPAAIPAHPLPPFNPPRPRSITLPEGPRVLLVPERTFPLVDGVLAFRTGIVSEPESAPGLVGILVDALRGGGSEEQPGPALERWLDARAATIEISAGPDHVELRFSCLSEDLEPLLQRLGDLLRAPAYPEAAVEAARRRSSSRARARRRDAAARADDALFMLAYESESPLAAGDGREVRREELLAFHRAELTLDRLLIGISGDVSAERLPALLSGALAGIPGVAAESGSGIRGLHFIQPSRTQIHVVDDPQAPWTELRLAGPGTRRLDPDGAALDLWSGVFGADGSASRMSVRLQSELEVEGPLRAAFQPGWVRAGRFETACRVPSESARAALAALLEVLRDGLQPVSTDELESARARLQNEELFRYRSAADVMRTALELALFEYPEDFWTRRTSELRELEPGAVADAVGRHLAPERLLVVVVGPADALLPELEPLGDVKVFDPDLAHRADPAQPLLVERMFRSLGGRELWARLVAVEADVTLLVDGKEIRTRQWHDVRLPRLRIVYQLGDEPLTTVLDGDVLRVRRGQVIDTLPADECASQLRAKRHSLWEILHRLALADEISVSADDAGVLTLTDPYGLDVELELDADHRPARMRFDDDGVPTVFTFDGWDLRDGYSYATLIRASPAKREWRVTRFRSLTSFAPELLFER